MDQMDELDKEFIALMKGNKYRYLLLKFRNSKLFKIFRKI